MQRGSGRASGAGRGGSVHEERAGELHVVEGGREFAAFAVHVGLHVGDAVVGLFPSQVLEGGGCPSAWPCCPPGGGGWSGRGGQQEPRAPASGRAVLRGHSAFADAMGWARGSAEKRDETPAPSRALHREVCAFRRLWPWGNLGLHSQRKPPPPGQGGRAPDLVQLLLGHIGLSLGAQGPEGALDLLAGFDILGFTADHEGHVLLQGDVAVPGEGRTR